MPDIISVENAKTLEELFNYANGGKLIIYREDEYVCMMHYMANALSAEDRKGFDDLAMEHIEMSVEEV